MPTRRAFVLGEALAVAAVVLIAASMLVVMGAEHRAAAGLSRDLGNLRQIGQWTHAYAADFEDRVPALDEVPDSQWPMLRTFPGTGQEISNAAKHAVDILRRRTGRADFPLPGNWIANVSYTHLVLADYADLPLPDRRFVATGDVHRMNWTDDPENKHDFNAWQPYQQPQCGSPGDPVPSHDQKWPYSSSFQITPAWYDEGQSDWSGSVGRLYQTTHNCYGSWNEILLKGQAVPSAAFPSRKVMWHAYADWYHHREPRHFTAPPDSGGSRATALMADASASAPHTLDANKGWDPRFPASPSGVVFAYAPRSWEPPTTNGNPAEPIRAGYYRWTRGGLKGRDLGGTEINTGQ